nr:hypothetical protein [Klebsiella quasipneumoniae]
MCPCGNHRTLYYGTGIYAVGAQLAMRAEY